MMPHPKNVFDNPDDYRAFITAPRDDDFEGQYFDRKECPQDEKNWKAFKKQVIECVSAFANANHEGGLLVIGVANDGRPIGINHLTEEQRNALTAFHDRLRYSTVLNTTVEWQTSEGKTIRLLLFYVGYSQGICETLDNPPKAWYRRETQNIPLDDSLREQIKREKGFVDWERQLCCPFFIDEVDEWVLQEFRRGYLAESGYEYTDVELLYNAGAIDKDAQGEYRFTNAGFLFFSKNPQRMFHWAEIRILRYGVRAEQYQNPGATDFDRPFSGSLPKQIEQIRAFIKNAGFFKVYQRRAEDGGFVEEPELPFIAVDEAIVNAVVHRDYAIQLPIKCYRYVDAFVVENPGKMLQEGQVLPARFTLDDVRLNPTARNFAIVKWFQTMKDDRGARFVRSLGEGTRSMRDKMLELGLPAPSYYHDHRRTAVTLETLAPEREKVIQNELSLSPGNQFANLFPLTFYRQGSLVQADEVLDAYKLVSLNALKKRLEEAGWFVDRFKFGRLVAHLKGSQFSLPDSVNGVVRFFPAYQFQIRQYWGKAYLCVDYTLEVKNLLYVHRLLQYLSPEEIVHLKALVKTQSGWQLGTIVSCDAETAAVRIDDELSQFPSGKVLPLLPIRLVKQVVAFVDRDFDLARKIKECSLASTRGASRKRAEKTEMVIKRLADEVFPLVVDDIEIDIAPQPLHFDAQSGFQVRVLPEPAVVVGHYQESANIRNGIIRFGSYENEPRDIEIVPVCITGFKKQMEELIRRLRTGSNKFKGAERTFGVRLTYSTIIMADDATDIVTQCQRLLEERPQWAENPSLNRIFLVHTPESGYATDDETSPYYQTKRLLLEQGIPCQMVDTPTLQNPQWKDLNLALNLVAKCGLTPWVLPNQIPDADFFVGLSYTQSRVRGLRRLLGYATVFNPYGRWQFYMGNTNTFSYEERTKYFASLTEKTLKRLDLSDTPHVYFHYSAKFSSEDRRAILSAARKVRPRGIYSFVWINAHHPIRLYDQNPTTDGSIERGTYIITSRNQFLLSTTGHNPYRKFLGTPKPLEITVWQDYPVDTPTSPPDLHTLALQILSLTKLNWASTESLTGEPITTKYARDIAYLTDAFLRDRSPFQLHPVLEKTPWFV